jgi:hypothetical protein
METPITARATPVTMFRLLLFSGLLSGLNSTFFLLDSIHSLKSFALHQDGREREAESITRLRFVLARSGCRNGC